MIVLLIQSVHNNQPLFFEIEVNSGKILSEPQSNEVNILLFTEIEKNNYCFSINFTHSVISKTLFFLWPSLCFLVQHLHGFSIFPLH